MCFSGWSFIIPARFLPFIKEAVFLLETDEKVKAIKTVRDGSPLNLRDAKHYIEDIQKKVQPPVDWNMCEVDRCEILIAC